MRSVSSRLLYGALAATVVILGAGMFLRSDARAAAESPRALRAGVATDTAVFAGGCFWSMEKAFEHVPGVISAISGFAGGHTANPSYKDVGSHATGHAEAVRVVFDPTLIDYARLLDIYWHNIDPLSTNGQFCDHGPQYRTIVFYRDATERRQAETSKARMQRHFNRPVTTQVEPAGPFYAAEAAHQDFAEKNPAHYNAYRLGCSRDRRLRELWGDSTGED